MKRPSGDQRGDHIPADPGSAENVARFQVYDMDGFAGGRVTVNGAEGN
jgi:hypothetical protein